MTAFEGKILSFEIDGHRFPAITREDSSDGTDFLLKETFIFEQMRKFIKSFDVCFGI